MINSIVKRFFPAITDFEIGFVSGILWSVFLQAVLFVVFFKVM